MKAPHEYHPPHVYIDNTIYFISVRTVNRVYFFNTDSKKEILRKVIIRAQQKFKVRIYAWVILSNHYHILFKTFRGTDLARFVKNINENSSRLLNQLGNKQGRKVWYQYWDYCIRDKKDFYRHFNYIHHNPVKHKLVKNQSEVISYKFCSYRDWMKNKGSEWMNDILRTYPIRDFTAREDGWVV